MRLSLLAVLTILVSVALYFVYLAPPAVDVNDETTADFIPEPPVTYQPLGMGFWSKTTFTESRDSVEIQSMPYTSKDSRGREYQHLFAIIEVYDRSGGLLRRLTQVGQDTSKVLNRVRLRTADSLYVRSWGFAYRIGSDPDTRFDTKRLYIATTPLREYYFPDGRLSH